MRRVLTLLCAAAVGVSLLGAAPATALEPTWISVLRDQPLLNENGDGFWETATVGLVTDADAAHWVLTRGTTVVAQGDLDDDLLGATRYGKVDVPISSATAGAPLAAGTYTYTVTATKAGKEPASDATDIYVSTAPALTSYSATATVLYPNDLYAGVAHTVGLRHRLDATIAQYGARNFEVVGADGVVVHRARTTAREPLLRWDGRYQPTANSSFVTAPAGTYRARLLIENNDGTGWIHGPLSQPFKVSRGYRVGQRSTVTRLANATRTATLTQRHGRLRIRDGILHYRRSSGGPSVTALVRTAHVVRVPSGPWVPGSAPMLMIRGRWHDFDVDLEVVTPTGQVRNVDVYMEGGPGYLGYQIPRSLIRADGTVRFRLVWSTWGAPDHPGLVSSVGVRVNRWVWRDRT